MIGDNVLVNMAVHHVCEMLDPSAVRLDLKEVRGCCIEHRIYLMACHFTCALGVPVLNKTKQWLHE
jgi:hypothetical protein